MSVFCMYLFLILDRMIVRVMRASERRVKLILKATLLRLPFVDLRPHSVAPTPADDVGLRPTPPPGIDLQARASLLYAASRPTHPTTTPPLASALRPSRTPVSCRAQRSTSFAHMASTLCAIAEGISILRKRLRVRGQWQWDCSS